MRTFHSCTVCKLFPLVRGVQPPKFLMHYLLLLSIKTILHLYLGFVNFAGVQSVRESGTSWRWQFTSAYTDWRRRTWRTTVWQSLPLMASDTYSPLAPGYCQYQEQGPRWAWGVSRSQVHSSGTVYQPPWKPQLSPHWRSLDTWRPTRSADRQRVWGPFMTRSTNLLIIIIIINTLHRYVHDSTK